MSTLRDVALTLSFLVGLVLLASCEGEGEDWYTEPIFDVTVRAWAEARSVVGESQRYEAAKCALYATCLDAGR